MGVRGRGGKKEEAFGKIAERFVWGAHLFCGEGVGISALFAGPVVPVVIEISIAQIPCRRRGVGEVFCRRYIPSVRVFKHGARQAVAILERITSDISDAAAVVTLVRLSQPENAASPMDVKIGRAHV